MMLLPVFSILRFVHFVKPQVFALLLFIAQENGAVHHASEELLSAIPARRTREVFHVLHMLPVDFLRIGFVKHNFQDEL